MGREATAYQCTFQNFGNRSVQPQVPTSIVLTQLLEDLPQDHVNLAWLIGRLQKRSFGLVKLLLALVGLVPGIGIFIGILLAFPAVQLIIGRETPNLPRFLTNSRVAT